jgi:hypothetical protein
MNDPPGVQSALGIEAFEWFAGGGDNLTVRVTGRWRRRRPAWGGQPSLVIEAQGQRHRFPAMPEPPSLTGAVPGTWRISFSVPAWLAPYLGERVWLQFGAVVVALPGTVEATAGAFGDEASRLPEGRLVHPERPLDPDTLAARRLRSAELAAESARRRAAEAEDAAAKLAATIEEFERQLDAARQESESLVAQLAERERHQREAQQRAHAELALRRELEEALAARKRDGEDARRTLGELAAAEERVRALEAEIVRLRRQADEAEQVAATARAARERTERQAAERTHALEEQARRQAASLAAAQARILARERAVAAHHAAAVLRVPAEPSPGSSELGGRLGSDHERASPADTPPAPPAPAAPALAAGALAHTVLALRRELETRATAEARLRAQLITAQGRLEARLAAESQLSTTLAQLRDELDSLRSEVELETAAREHAQLRAARLERELEKQRARSEQAYNAIEELRRALDLLRAAGAPPRPPHDPAGPVEATRLGEALMRLRETIAPEIVGSVEDEAGRAPEPPPAVSEDETVPVPAPATKPWLDSVFRQLTRDDAVRAGRLLLSLLPAQHAAYPRPVAYDLVLTGGDAADGTGGESGTPVTVQVTVRDGAPEISYADAPRDRSAVSFQVRGDLASLARLLAAGPLRRRLRLGVARVRGDRDALAALMSLLRTPLSLRDLHDAGVRIDPVMALHLAALMIDPAWTAGERFTFALREPGGASASLGVNDGGRVTAAEGGPDAPAATLVAPAGSLLLALTGERASEVATEGDERVLALVRGWIKRAQSG